MKPRAVPSFSPSGTGEPFASVVISVHNDREHLRDCLCSLRKQHYRNFEVIVVDAGSTDGTGDMVKDEHPEVRLIITKKVGIGEATNKALLAAKGDYIVFDLNSDDIVSPTWLRNLVEFMENNTSVGVLGGKRYAYGTDTIDSAGGSINFLTGDGPPIGHGKRDCGDYSTAREVDYVPVIMTRRDVLHTVGLLDEGYSLYFEEPDFCLRAKRCGYKVMYTPNAVHWHRGASVIGGSSLKQYYYLRRNQLRFVIKNFAMHYLMISLFWLLVVRVFLDALSTTSWFVSLMRTVRPSSMWPEFDKRVPSVQLHAIAWNVFHFKEIVRMRGRGADH